MKVFLSIVLVVISSFVVSVGQSKQNLSENNNFDPAKVEVMVVGSYHLSQINFDETPISTNLIRLSLMKYRPDQIVVEWLHPSIDLATTFNYRPFVNLEALAKLWGYQIAKVKETLEAVKQLLEEQKKRNPHPQVISQIPTTGDGLSQMRWVQSPQYLAAERKVHLEIVPGISLNGLGQARTDGNLRRNELMMDFAESDIKRLNSKRVMIIVGYGHKFFLEILLKKRGYQIIPSTDFMP